jgi:RNA polymerase sigma factor (sigma-70 family)
MRALRAPLRLTVSPARLCRVVYADFLAEQSLLNQDCSAQLRTCLAQMSRDHREVIELVYYREKSVEEVAEIVQMPKNTVKTRMFCAPQEARQVMSTHQDFDHLIVAQAA